MDLMDYRRKIIANSPHLMSASGAVVSFSDGADLPLKSLIVDIEPVQSGSGDPSPVNFRPISGRNGVKVTRSGENVLKPSTAFTETQNGLTFTSDGKGTYSVKGTNTATATVRSAILPVSSFTIPPSTTHTLYINNNAINSDVLLSFMIGSTAIDSWAFNALNRVVSTYGAMGNKLCDGVQIVVRAGQTVDITFSPMLLPKENADVYNISFSSAGTVYGGTLNPLTGVLTVDRVGVPMQSLTWYRSTSYANPIFYTTITGKASDYRKSACSILRDIGSSTIIAARGFATQSANGDFASSNGNAQIYARYDSATTVQEFVTAVTGQTIVYPLATPTTIQLTPHQIRSLYGNNTIFADTGNVALEYWAHP